MTIISKSKSNDVRKKNHSIIGFLQQSPLLHLQYLQHLTPATLVLSKFILTALLLIEARCISSNVFRSVDGLRHLTKNVSSIYIELSVSCVELKFLIIEQFPGLQIVFRTASLVPIWLVVSHPVSAWSAGRHCVSSSPSAVQMSWGGKIYFLTYKCGGMKVIVTGKS